MLIFTLQILLKVHNDPSLCKLQINAQWTEATIRFNDESTICQFLKYQIDQKSTNIITLCMSIQNDNIFLENPSEITIWKNALTYTEEKQRSYAKHKGMTVTNSIIDDNLEITMFLPPGPALRRLETRSIIVPLKSPSE